MQPTQSATPVEGDRLREQQGRFTRPAVLIQIALILFLAAMPLLVPSFRVMDVLAKIMIFTVAVASYDLLLGYTGIFSLAHGMFFGIGAYAMGLVLYRAGAAGAHWMHMLLAVGVAGVLSVGLSLVITFFSLRVKAIFFTMMTLALAEFALILATTWYDLTRAENGVSFELPGILSVGWSAGAFLRGEVNGRLMTYYLILAAAGVLFIGMLRFVNSPVGRVLKAIRDNDMRATALGYDTLRYQVLSTVFGSTLAAFAGVLFAMWLRFVNPSSVLSINPLMLNMLLMLIIGGMGTLHGAIIGAAFILAIQAWLPDLQKVGTAFFPNIPVVQRLLERWELYFGILFILIVFFFPKGIVGTARAALDRRRTSRARSDVHAES
jgi:branched-chain amino acid transport system permease protein